jgi:hypothetical protein
MKSTFSLTSFGSLPPLRLTSTRRLSASMSAIICSMLFALIVV